MFDSHLSVDSQVTAVFCRPIRQKIVHFGDVLPSQSLGLVPKKLDLTEQKQTTQKNKKQKYKEIVNLTQQSTLTTAYVYVRCTNVVYAITSSAVVEMDDRLATIMHQRHTGQTEAYMTGQDRTDNDPIT